MTLQEAVSNIEPLDQKAMVIAQKRWDSIAKPCLLYTSPSPRDP